MTYRSIDKRRFSFLLSLGTDEFELKRFFTDCRIQLIQRGGRVQNLPNGDKARIRALVHELPASTDDVVRDWFSENLALSDPESPEKIVETFKLHEEVQEEVDEQTAKRLARSCLVHLFGESPSGVLLEFLKTPIGGVEKPEQQPTVSTVSERVDWQSVVHVMLDLMQGHDIDKHVDGLPPALASVASGLQAAAQGQLDEARLALDALPTDAAGRALLDQYIRQQEARGGKEPPKGPTVLMPDGFAGSFDFENDEILGFCTKAESPNAVFVHPIAVVRANSIQALTAEGRRKLFPSTGDVMAFPGARYPRQPRRGEVGVWRVEEHETDKATHFHIAGDLRKVHELVAVPFSSSDYDSVREFIKEHVQRITLRFLQSPLFVLADGLIVGPRLDRADLTKDEAFESGLPSWNTLSGWRLEGRQFVVGPLPKEQGTYECAALASSIRKLLKPYIGVGAKTAGGFTKAHVAELTQLLGSGEMDLTAKRLQRIKSELEEIQQNQDALEALVEQIQAHPSVKERVDALVREGAAKRLAEKTEIQAEVARLQKERAEWEERIRKQKEDHRKLRDDTAKVVRAAFEKARTEGVATLAELAIFQELTRSSGQQGAAAGGISFQPRVRVLKSVEADPVAILRALGVSNQKATAFVAVSKVVLGAGLILCVRGIAARHAVERWAQSMGSSAIVESSIGLVDDAPIRNLVDGMPRPQIVAVLDANLSALDIYARPIADAVISTVTNGQAPTTSFLFALTESVGQLPMPKSFERLSVSIDLEAKYEFGNSDIGNLIQQAFDPVDGVLQARIWTPAVERLRAELVRMDAETQALVLAVLNAQRI
jgi:hypothetical protein